MKVKPISLEDYFSNNTLEKERQLLNPIESTPPTRGNARSYKLPEKNHKILDVCKKDIIDIDKSLITTYIALLVIGLFQHNIYFYNNYNSTELVDCLRIVNIVLAFCSVIWVIQRYHIIESIMLSKFQILPGDTIFSTSIYQGMILELILAFSVMPPYSDVTFYVQMLGFEVEYSLSAFFTFFAMVKVFYSLRFFGHYSEYTQNRAKKVCKRHHVEADSKFAWKAFIIETPFIGIGLAFIVLSFFFAGSMKLCEEPDITVNGETYSNALSLFADDLWVVFYTSTTVGYGNLYPKTHFGRVFCIIACILGTVYLGMLVVAIHQKMELDYKQTLSYASISRKSYSEQRTKYAKIAIIKALTLFLLSRKWKSRAISPIKPNGRVVIKGVTLNNDLLFLTEAQFKVKLGLYRELKGALEKCNDLLKLSRDVGKNEMDIIYEIEDSIRVDFRDIVKKIKGKVDYNALEKSEDLMHYSQYFEVKCEAIKDLSRKIKHAGYSLYGKGRNKTEIRSKLGERLITEAITKNKILKLNK